MEDNIKKIVERHIAKGLEKMQEWEDVSSHVISTHKRSMRFLAMDIVDELSGNVQPTDLTNDF